MGGIGILLAGSALLGCRQDEQNRILAYEKGKYLGKADQKLSSEGVNRLRLRVANQRAR
jgi:hypothetical protein